MDKKFKETQFINVGNLPNIHTSSKASTENDLGKALQMLGKYVHEKAIDRKNIEILEFSGERDRELYNFSTQFNDPMVYRDDEKLAQLKSSYESFEKAYEERLGAMSISDMEYTKLNEDFTNKRNKISQTIEMQEKDLLIKREQEAGFKDISERTNRLLSGAYSGNYNFNDEDFESIEATTREFVKKGFLTEIQADNMLSDTMGKATVIGAINKRINGIMNGGGSAESKMLALEEVERTVQSDSFMKSLSQFVSDGTKVSKETAEIAIRDNMRNGLSLINQNYARLNTQLARAKRKRGLGSGEGQKIMTYEQSLKYNELISHNKLYDGYRYKTEKTGGRPVYTNSYSYYSAPDVQEQLKVDVDFSDRNSNLSIANAVDKSVIDRISGIDIKNIGTAKEVTLQQFTGVSEEEINAMSKEDVVMLVGMSALEKVGLTTGAFDPSTGNADVVGASKFLVGAGIGEIAFNHNGENVLIDLNSYNLVQAIADGNSVKANQYRKEIVDNKKMERITDFMNEMSKYQNSGIEDKKYEEKLNQDYLTMGIALPKNKIDGKGFSASKKDKSYSSGDRMSKMAGDVTKRMTNEKTVPENVNLLNFADKVHNSEPFREAVLERAVLYYNEFGVTEKEKINGFDEKKLFTEELEGGKTAVDYAMEYFIKNETNNPDSAYGRKLKFINK